MIPSTATTPMTVLSPLHAVDAESLRYGYLLALPRDAAAEPARRWPVLLFLHGAAERGAEIWDVARHGPPKLLHGAMSLTPAESAAARLLAESFIVVAPQCPQFEVWDDAALLDLLDRVVASTNADRQRVYLTGLSMGGFGVWSVAMRQPGRFAAIAPVCGGGRIADILASERERASELRNLGVWAFHGARDRVVPLDESERMVAALERAGMPDVRLTVYPDAEHDSWTQTYANQELYTWLLRHGRRSAR